MINAVAVTKDLFNLASFEAAVAMTQALQFQIECDLDTELQQMVSENILTAEEWQFVDATLHLISGNVFVSTVMSRYGGEDYKIPYTAARGETSQGHGSGNPHKKGNAFLRRLITFTRGLHGGRRVL